VVAGAAVAVAVACAGGGGGSHQHRRDPAERQRVQNLVPFDVANCFPSKLDLGKTANEYTLQAAFRGARPAINECLADGKVQNASAATKGKASISMDASGTSVTVTGDGLQPRPTACIEKVNPRPAGGVSAPSGGEALTLDGPFERDPASMVRMGLNEASDVQGSIRLGVPQWCSCFDSIKTQAPPSSPER
jgi:hypothetical protein